MEEEIEMSKREKKNYKQNEMTTGKSAQNSVKREHSSAQFREIY